MNQAYWTPERAAGSLLVASLVILLLAALILITSGAMHGLTAMVQGSLAQVVPYASTLRILILMFVISWIVQLLGLSLFTRLLVRAGDEQLAILSFALILVATILFVLYSTFRMSVELWAAQEAARTGHVPGFFEPLKTWTSNFESLAARIHFAAMIGFGVGILRTELLPQWVGQVAIGWSVLLFVGTVVGNLPPATPLLMPVLIGAALLRN